MQNNKPKKRTAMWIVIVALIVICTNFITYLVCTYMPVFLGKSVIVKADDADAASAINKMLYISQKLDDNFLWETDNQKMWDSALKGLMEGTGDEYAAYYNKEEYANYKDSVNKSI